MNISVGDIEMIDNHVLIKQDKGQAITDSGIYIPENARIKPLTGIIVSISLQDTEMNLSGLKLGDRVLFTKHKTHLYIHNNEEYALVSFPQIMALIETDEYVGTDGM